MHHACHSFYRLIKALRLVELRRTRYELYLYWSRGVPVVRVYCIRTTFFHVLADSVEQLIISQRVKKRRKYCLLLLVPWAHCIVIKYLCIQPTIYDYCLFLLIKERRECLRTRSMPIICSSGGEANLQSYQYRNFLLKGYVCIYICNEEGTICTAF